MTDCREIHTVRTSIAGVEITWRTDCIHEVEELNRVLRYHLIPLSTDPEGDGKESPGGSLYGEESHMVEFVQVESPTEIPSDRTLVWEGPYMGLTTSRNKVRWVNSAATRLDYLVLTDEIMIIHDRRNHVTRCELLSRRHQDKWVRPRIWDALVVMLHTIMSMHGRYSIHSAASGIDGQAHLFVGESGHGKSTLCTDLAAMGADYLGDDLIFLYLKDNKIQAGSLLLDAKLFTDRRAKEKDWVDIIALTGCRAPLSLPLKNIYYIARAKGESRLLPREPIDCMVTLLKASNNVRMQYDSELWQSTLETASTDCRFSNFLFGNRSTLTPDIFRNA